MKAVKIASIHKNPQNPRTIKDDNFKKLVKSLQDFPEMMKLRPIIVNTDMMILGGNMRYEAAKAAGWKEVPVEVADLSEEKQREFIIKDNVSGGDWDWDLLADWDTGKLEEWGLEIPDFDEKSLSANDDDYEIPDEIKTDIVVGDLFQIGDHRLLCADCLDGDNVARLMDGEKADMVFTDPPYDLEDVSWSERIFDYVKDDRHVFIMNSDKLLIDIINVLYKQFRKIFSVDFRQARLVSNNMPMTRVDLVAEFCNGKTRFQNRYDGFSTLIECAKIHNKDTEKNFGHGQAKNPELPGKFIEHYTLEHELVLDLFGGSGSTMAASEQLKRKCYSVELEPKNCQIILDRMKKCYNLESNKIH